MVIYTMVESVKKSPKKQLQDNKRKTLLKFGQFSQHQQWSFDEIGENMGLCHAYYPRGYSYVIIDYQKGLHRQNMHNSPLRSI